MNLFNTIFDIITVILVGLTSLLLVADLYIDATTSELSDELSLILLCQHKQNSETQ